MSRHLLVIGAQRCGTTYLHSLLDGHPDIAMALPALPEPKVFLSDAQAAKGYGWYRETYFGHATSQTLLGEKSTSYIEDPKAPARVRRVLGVTEIVVLLRDPVQRAVSNWRFSTDNGLEERTLETALRENLAGTKAWDRRSSSVSPYHYLERGRYVDYLPPWFATFPSSTHVLFSQPLMNDDAVLRRLFDSLGVDPGFRPSHQGRVVNQSREPAPELSAELAGLLRRYFTESDRALSQLLGRDLPWAASAGQGVADE
ncbi:MAG TPA: sulfotransferase domain-containing protein [Nocardioidaceae bacterium]|nr:sulfotransferase domain-containing protein [Nocardioidaceae bacterium]